MVVVVAVVVALALVDERDLLRTINLKTRQNWIWRYYQQLQGRGYLMKLLMEEGGATARPTEPHHGLQLDMKRTSRFR